MSLHLALAVLPLLAASASPQGHALKTPLARGAAGELFPIAQWTPDGERVLFSADEEGDGFQDDELLSVKGWGGRAAVALGVGSFTHVYVPDSEEVVGGGRDGLVRVRDDGNGRRIPITPPFPDGVVVLRLLLAGEHVVYLAGVYEDERYELHSVPLAGDALPVRLNGPLVPGGSVLDVQVSPDGRTLLYRADQDADGVVELFVVSADGSAPARALPIPLVAGGDVGDVYGFDREGTRALFCADQDEDERVELFTVALDGSDAPRRLSPQLVENGDVGISRGGRFPMLFSWFSLTPDGRRVVFPADARVDQLFELWSAPLDGSEAPVVLASPLSADSTFWWVYTPDSSRLLFSDRTSGSTGIELFSVPVNGSAMPVSLSGPLVPGGNAGYPRLAPDGRTVVYPADQELDGRYELYSVPADGSGAPFKLNAPFPPGGGLVASPSNFLYWYEVLPEGVVYLADQEVAGLDELYLVPLEGGAPRKLAPGPITGFFAGPEARRGRQVAYLSAESLSAVELAPRGRIIELYSLP
jgi:Tol biopolymer transport system component